MEICPGDYISELLLNHKSVSLPKVGGFLTQTRSAQLDEGLGKLIPPSKKIIFTPNLAIDDGLLVNYMMQKFGFSLEEATEVLLDYCQDINHALNNKEFFSIKGIGRIYKDFEGKIKFLPNHSNLNTDAFGLPDVDFSPMAQESTAVRQSTIASNEPITPETSTSSATETTHTWWQKNGKLVAALSALLLIVFMGFFVVNRGGQKEKNIAHIPSDRTNISPIPVNNTADNKDEKNSDDLALNPDEESAPIEDTEQPTIAPNQKVAVIAIGKFGNPENVKALVKKIFDEGFDPYQEKLGKLTRVGIQFPYEDEAEVYQTLKQVRKLFEPDAEILKK